jgi:hypothetical protein
MGQKEGDDEREETKSAHGDRQHSPPMAVAASA